MWSTASKPSSGSGGGAGPISDLDASANPNYPAASKGDRYRITVAGKVGGASGKVVEAGDTIEALATNAGGTEAAVGTSWFAMQANIAGITAAGLSMIQAADVAAQRTLLGMGTMALQAASSVAITGGTAAGLTGLGIRSTGAAFDLTLASAEVLTAGRTLTFNVGDAARTLALTGNPTLSGITTTGTGTIASTTGKTFTFSNTLTLAGTDASTLNIGTGGTLGTAAFTSATAYVASASVTGGGILATGGFTLTVPATGTAQLTGAALALAGFSSITGTLAAANGGTGVSNAGTFTNASNTTVTGGGTVALGGFTLTVTATGTAALLGTANVFTATQRISNAGAASLELASGANIATMIQSGTSLTFTTSNSTSDILFKDAGGSYTMRLEWGIAASFPNYGIALSSTNSATGSNDCYLLRKAAASWQLGQDAAGVTNQFITAASRITSDGVGANLTIAAGNGRGAAGGSLLLSYYTTAGAATIGTLTTAMTINTIGAITCAGNLVTAASTTTISGLNIPSGTAPTSPVSGDMWYDGTNLRFRDGSTTRILTWV